MSSHPQITQEIKVIQDQYSLLLHQIKTRHWSPAHRHLLKALQIIYLQIQCTELCNQFWEKKIRETDDRYKDPRAFW